MPVDLFINWLEFLLYPLITFFFMLLENLEEILFRFKDF